jgi:hypothetical protein
VYWIKKKKKKIVIFSLRKWLLGNYKNPWFKKRISFLNLYNPLFIEAANRSVIKKAVREPEWIDQNIYYYFSTIVNLTRCITDACKNNRIMKPGTHYYSPVLLLKILLKLQDSFNNKELFKNFLHFKGAYEGCGFYQVSDYPTALFTKELFTRVKYPAQQKDKNIIIETPELNRDPKIEGIICPQNDVENIGLQSDDPDGPVFTPLSYGETPWAIFKYILTGIASVDIPYIPVPDCKKNPWVAFLDENIVTREMIDIAEKCVHDGKFVNEWVENISEKEDETNRTTRIDESIDNFPTL